MFKYSFLYRTHHVRYTFPKFYVMIEFLGCLLVQNWYFSYFLCHCFGFHNSSVRIGNPLLFRIYVVFIPKFSLSVTLARIARTAPLLFWLNHSRIIATYPGNLLWKMWIWVFEYYAMLSFFFRSGLARHG